MRWVFQATNPMGGATGEAFSNVLQGTGMGNSAVLAREAIQNSVDAKLEDGNGKVEMRFRHLTLTGERKTSLVSTLQLDEHFVDRRDVLTVHSGSCLESLAEQDVPLSVLFVEDFGTHGLYGDPAVPTSHFHRLLFTLGDSTKARGETGSGGSYGYGKGVYSSNSLVRTIIAYSVFEKESENDGVWARLIGCSYFNSHKFNDKYFTGRAWFGVPDEHEPELVVHPFVNEQAQQVAAALGFTSRAKNATGTSILILDCPLDVDELRTAVEDWWWPRLVSDELDVVIMDNEKRLDPPRPRKRPELEPFIRGFSMAIGLAEPSGEHEKADKFNALKQTPLGTYGLVVVDAPEATEDSVVPRVGTVALIRSPRMVVSYLPVGGNLMPFKGAVVASGEIDHALKLSEPPAHDKWDPRSDRFTNEEQRALVEALLKRAVSNVRKFAKEAAPPTPSGEVRMDLLERLLGSAFRLPTLPGASGPDGDSEPIHVEFSKAPSFTIRDDRKQVHGEVAVRLSERAESDVVLASIEVRCYPKEDEGVGSRDPIAIRLRPDIESQSLVRNSQDGRVIGALDKVHGLRCSFESAPYPGDWTVSVDVVVSGIGQE